MSRFPCNIKELHNSGFCRSVKLFLFGRFQMFK